MTHRPLTLDGGRTTPITIYGASHDLRAARAHATTVEKIASSTE